MVLNFILIYLYIFFILSFIMYFAYSMIIVPEAVKLSSSIKNKFESIISDYALLMVLLLIFLLINNSFFHINHILIILIEYIIGLSCGVFLASFISNKLVNHYKMMPKSKIISYILLFLLIFSLYTAVFLTPSNS